MNELYSTSEVASITAQKLKYVKKYALRKKIHKQDLVYKFTKEDIDEMIKHIQKLELKK